MHVSNLRPSFVSAGSGCCLTQAPQAGCSKVRNYTPRIKQCEDCNNDLHILNNSMCTPASMNCLTEYKGWLVVDPQIAPGLSFEFSQIHLSNVQPAQKENRLFKMTRQLTPQKISKSYEFFFVKMQLAQLMQRGVFICWHELIITNWGVFFFIPQPS